MTRYSKHKKHGRKYEDIPLSIQTLPEGNANCTAGGFKIAHGDEQALYLCHPRGNNIVPPQPEPTPNGPLQQVRSVLQGRKWKQQTQTQTQYMNQPQQQPLFSSPALPIPVVTPPNLPATAECNQQLLQQGQPQTQTLGQMLLERLGVKK